MGAWDEISCNWRTVDQDENQRYVQEVFPRSVQRLAVQSVEMVQTKHEIKHQFFDVYVAHQGIAQKIRTYKSAETETIRDQEYCGNYVFLKFPLAGGLDNTRKNQAHMSILR